MSSITKKNILLHIKGIVTVTLFGVVIAFLMSDPSNFTWRHMGINLSYCLMIGSALWIGNYSINPVLEAILGEKQLSPGWKMVAGLFCMFILSSAIILFVNWFWVVVIWESEFKSYIDGSGMSIMILELVAVVMIALIMYTSEYFRSWRASVKKEESLEREKLALQYEALRNQVNPHFLFNSLNTLSGLIDKDAGKATLFVKQLSDIYRYVLEQKDRELVPLDTEMKFVDNYISLMKIRFGENLQITRNVPSGSPNRLIPLSIQMLIENAIKHNIISKDLPLSISITVSENGILEVKNNLQPKSSILHEEVGDWEKHGLVNLKSRYTYLAAGRFMVNGSTEEPFQEQLDGYFSVQMPLISS